MSAPIPLPRWVDAALVPLLNVATAFFVAGLAIWAMGDDPIEAVRLLIWGALGSGSNIGMTLYYATSFVFTGLAVAVASHGGLFNIGGEGQAYIGGLGAATVALVLGATAPWWAVFPVATLAAAAAGAAWAFLPGWMQAKRGAHIVISTIMFNFLAAALMSYLLVEVFRPEGQMQPGSARFPAGGSLPSMSEAAGWLGIDIPRTKWNVSFLLALAALAAVWALIWRTRFGYALRAVGHNPRAAHYAGMNGPRIVILVMMISGALAGLAAVNECMGGNKRLLIEFVAGAGFIGIAVALMGRNHPVGVALAALLFGVLKQGGGELSWEMQIPADMIVLIQGLVILFSGAMNNLYRPYLGRIFGKLARGGA